MRDREMDGAIKAMRDRGNVRENDMNHLGHDSGRDASRHLELAHSLLAEAGGRGSREQLDKKWVTGDMTMTDIRILEEGIGPPTHLFVSQTLMVLS